MPDERVFEVLLIEDNPADAKILQFAFAECPVAKTHVSILNDSKDAIHYMHGLGRYSGVAIPDLILLDYHLPVNGGIALAELKGNPDFHHIPVIVVTGSENQRDVDEVYRRHGNCVFYKPGQLEDVMELVCEISTMWLKRARLPSRKKPSPPVGPLRV